MTRTRQFGYLCESNAIFPTLKETLCDSVDLAADPGADFTGVACDAVSAAVRFVGEPAQMSPAKDGPDAGASPCPALTTTSCP